jgi:hypothetical protein
LKEIREPRRLAGSHRVGCVAHLPEDRIRIPKPPRKPRVKPFSHAIDDVTGEPTHGAGCGMVPMSGASDQENVVAVRDIQECE